MKTNIKKVILIYIIAVSCYLYNINQYQQNVVCNTELNALQTEIISLKDSLEESKVLNEVNVWNYINYLELKCPKIVLKQCLLESGNFKSGLVKSNNNILGLRCAKSRPYTYIGKKYGYAVFTDWKSCIDDYKLLQDKHFKGETYKEYYYWLSRSYAQDPLYIQKLKNTRLKVK